MSLIGAEAHILFPAASDAYCLLEIYERLCKDPESFGLGSDLTESLVGKQSKKPRAKKQLNKQEAPSPSGQVCKHLQRAACCSRSLQITHCWSEPHHSLCMTVLRTLAANILLIPPSLPGHCALSLACLGPAFPLRFTCLCTVWVEICAQSPVSLAHGNIPSTFWVWILWPRFQNSYFLTFVFY